MLRPGPSSAPTPQLLPKLQIFKYFAFSRTGTSTLELKSLALYLLRLDLMRLT